MLIQTQLGIPAQKATGTPNVPGGIFGEMLESRLNPDYHFLLKQGLVFTSSLVGANPASFVGGAGGTPLLGLFNPAGSGKDLVLLEAVLGIRTTGTVAASEDFNHWGVNQGGAAVTGVGTAARNLYSLAATGSVALAMQNVVNTGALASQLLRPSFSLGAVAAAAALTPGLFRDEIKGEIIVAPGCYYAFGAAAALTGALLDVSLMWAELPV